MLRVSRRTLTVALAQLQRAGVVKSESTRGHRILGLKGRPGGAAPLAQIGLLTPEPLDEMRPGATLWVNDLQALLAERHYRLNFFCGRRYMSRQPGRLLSRLVEGNRQTCWILAGSTEPTQRWFASEKIPAVVVGTCHGDVVLPDVDIDFYAMGRHVAGRVAAFRHHKAALFLTNFPGYFTSETESERGFREVLRSAGREAQVVYHERTRESLLRVLRRVLSGPNYATAIVLCNSLDYLTAASFLARRGLRFPEDVSVIARNDDAFMTALLPTPTRYHVSPHLIAQRIFRLLMQVVAGQTPLRPHIRIMPDFIAGESLGPPPGATSRRALP